MSSSARDTTADSDPADGIGRVFLVGCPRSGTTLLQSILAGHRLVASFPESHFFRRLFPGRPILCKLRLASRTARPRFDQFLMELGHPELRQLLPRTALFARQYVGSFVKALDTVTMQQGKRLWIEKTPSHLHHVGDIEAMIPGCRFIHIIRNGPDVVASLYATTQKHPDSWGGAREIDVCIDRWIEDVGITRMHSGKINHRVVRYEELVKDPRDVLDSLCEFLGIDYEPEMLARRGQAADRVVLPGESWKESVKGPIIFTKGQRFYQVFDEAQRGRVLQRLGDAGMEIPLEGN